MYAQEAAVRRELRDVRRGSVLGGRAPGETRRGPARNQAKRSLQGEGESLCPRDRRLREGGGERGPWSSLRAWDCLEREDTKHGDGRLDSKGHGRPWKPQFASD